jgi:hypothetical protein
MTVGSLMPWITGSTRVNGYLDWTGLDDTGEGTMLIAGALGLVAWIRLREVLERELTPATRFIPLAVATACLLVWVIAFQKMLYLSWFDLPVGARPQAGLLVAAVGVASALVGALLAATDPDSVAAARVRAERERQRSGAAGDGAASERLRRGGGGSPPNPDEYSVVSRVDRASGPSDAGSDDDRARGSVPPRSS